MAIDFDRFLSWAESRWDGDVKIKGREIKLNSPFCEDYKYHLWCNPDGGKKNRDYGVYRCWKTDKRGTLVGLVMEIEKCSFSEALEILNAHDFDLARMEKEALRLIEGTSAEDVEVPLKERKIELPEQTYPILSLPEDDYFRNEAELYLKNRKLDSKGLMICCGGEFRGRIVIPYYDKEGNLIYWNARLIKPSKKSPKYRGPDKSITGKGEVVYLPTWPEEGEKIHLTEGEFDAKSLCMCGFDGGALGGKALSESQINLLRGHPIVLCLDNDIAGKQGLIQVGKDLLANGFKTTYVRPPIQHKDWNEMLQNYRPRLIHTYIVQHEKLLDQITIMRLEADAVKLKTKVRVDSENQKNFRSFPWKTNNGSNSSDKS